MAKTGKKARRKPDGRRGGAARAFASPLSTLARAYGCRRRPAGEGPLDRAVLAVLVEGRGERDAARQAKRLRREFVDWNEVRVARSRDVAALAPDLPEERIKKMQALLQAFYDNLGGLDLGPLLARNPSEARAWLSRLGPLSREEVEAVMLFALEQPVMPAGEELARVLRRLGLVARKATRAAAGRAALRGLDPEQYRDFYGLVSQHAGSVCHAEMPECRRCKLRRACKSKGRW